MRVGWGVWARCGGNGSSIRGCRRSRSGWSARCGKIRADRCYAKLKALGFEGSDRTVRRAVAEAKKSFGAGRRRVYRPWIPEPGHVGAVGLGRRSGHRRAKDESVLCVAGVVEVPGGDRDLGPHPAHGDRLCRPCHEGLRWCTDVLAHRQRAHGHDRSRRRGARCRHPEIVAVGGHYGITVATCVPADPESKGGSEATVRVAKADLVPTDANLRGDYTSWAELVEACEAFIVEVNARVSIE